MKTKLKYWNTFKTILLVFAAIQVGLGICWMLMNWGHLSTYGDTSEYIRLSETLLVDDYRKILYPFVIRICKLTERINIPFIYPLYLIQTLISFFAWEYAAKMVIGILIDKQMLDISPSKMKRFAITSSMIMITNPLIAHFNFTVLTDSMAASFTVVFCTVISWICYYNRVTLKHYIILLISFLILANIRTERLLLGVGIMALTALSFVVIRRSIKAVKWRSCFIICTIATILFTNILATMTCDTQSMRPPFGVQQLIFNKAAWPRMERVYPHLSEETRSLFTIEQAREFDTMPQAIMYVFLPEVTHNDPDILQKIYQGVSPICLKLYWTEIVGDTLRCMLYYVACPLAMSLDYNGLIQGTTPYAFAQMSVATPMLSKIYFQLYLYVVPVFMLIIGILFFIICRLKTKGVMVACTAYLWAIGGLAVGFSWEAALGYRNIRLGLGIYGIWMMLALVGLLMIDKEICTKQMNRS